MAKEYRYRRHIRWAQYVFAVLFVGIIALFWMISRFMLNDSRVLLPLYIIFFVEGVFIWYVFHYLSRVSITIKDDAIVYRYRRKEKRIPFENVLHVRFQFLRYVGGWVKIVSKKHKICLTGAVEDIGGLFQELKDALDSRGLSDCYDETKFFHFLKTATYSDQSWARLYSVFTRLVLFVILGILGGLALAVFGEDNFLLRVWLVFLSAFWPIVIYLCTEILFARYVARNAVRESLTFPERDHNYERTVYRKAVFIGMFLYIVFALLAAIILDCL